MVSFNYDSCVSTMASIVEDNSNRQGADVLDEWLSLTVLFLLFFTPPCNCVFRVIVEYRRSALFALLCLLSERFDGLYTVELWRGVIKRVLTYNFMREKQVVMGLGSSV